MKAQTFWGNPFRKKTTDREIDINFMSSVPLFDTLTRRQKTKLYSIIHVRHYQQGELVFRQGDPGVGLYIVRDGQIDVFTEGSDMTRNKIASLSKGDFFGDISLLNESPRSATAVAAKNSRLFGLFKPDLLSIMDSDPKLGLRFIYRIAQIIAERLRLINESALSDQ